MYHCGVKTCRAGDPDSRCVFTRVDYEVVKALRFDGCRHSVKNVTESLLDDNGELANYISKW